jgi:hypothetical protein
MAPPIVDAKGTLFERAAGQAEALRPQLPFFFSEGFSGLLPSWIPASAIKAALWVLGTLYLRWHRPLHEKPEFAHHRGGVEALAKAAGISPAILYGFHAVESETASPGFSMGCTSLAFSAQNTSDGPKLAYNHDFPPAFQPFLLVRRNAAAGRYHSVSVSYTCLMGAINGINEHGLAVSVNQAYATDLDRKRPALFVTMLVQECLDRCASVAEALELIQQSQVAAGCMVTLVDENDRAVVELSGTRSMVRRAEDEDVLYTFNAYRVPSMREIEVPVGALTTGVVKGYDLHRCNLTRERRYLQRVRGGEVWSDDEIKALLSDHDDGVGTSDTICRHDDPVSETILSTIADPRSRSLKVLVGRPCVNTHVEYRVLEAAIATV